MIVTTLQITSNITLLGSEHLPGLQMGDIDHESRREDHIRVGDYSTPTLLPELFINLESNSEIMAIISDCSPFKSVHSKEKDFHNIFLGTQRRLATIFPTLSI